MLKKIMVLLSVILLSVESFATGKAIFQRSLGEGIEALKSQNWAHLNDLVTAAEGAVQIVAANGERNFITYDLPVEVGKSYGGSIMVRCQDVTLRNNQDRGASFCFGMLDEQKQWVSGGEFPRGLSGSQDWRKIEIGLSRPMPDNVRYIQIWVYLEGQGTAQFKDLEVHPVDLAEGWKVDAAANPPTFYFSVPKNLVSGAMESRLLLQLSRAPGADEKDSLLELVPKDADGAFVFPYALAPGQWHVAAASIGRTRFAGMNASFTIGALPENFVPKVTPSFPNGAITARPDFKFNFYPKCPAQFTATLDGALLALVSASENQGNGGDAAGSAQVVFQPQADVAPGLHDVVVTANGHVTKHLFVNKKPAHQFALRDDNMPMIDGKPFFYIATTRDPSDNDKIFDGILEASFNATHSYTFEHGVVEDSVITAYLDDCHAHGIFTYMGIPRDLLKAEKLYAIQRHCAVMYDHPALGLYYLADEPELWCNTHSVKLLADAVREACPNVPRIMLASVVSGNYLPNVMKNADGLSEVFWHDPYPIPNAPITTVKQNMLEAKKITRNKQSVWCVIQCFDWDQQLVRQKSYEEVNPRAGQIRCMTHLALAADVHGLDFYWLPNSRYDMRIHAPIQWAETVAVVRELNTIYPFLIGRNAPQDIPGLPEGADYWCRKAEDGRHALGLINTTDKPISFHLKALTFDQDITLGPWGVTVLQQR